MPRRDAVEQLAEHRIIFGVERQRVAHQRLVRLAGLPHLEPPALLGSRIDRLVGAAVEVELEARAMHDDMRRHAPHRLAGKRILLAQPLRVAERHRRRHLRPKLMAVMDRRRHHRPGPLLDGPRVRVWNGHERTKRCRPLSVPPRCTHGTALTRQWRGRATHSAQPAVGG